MPLVSCSRIYPFGGHVVYLLISGRLLFNSVGRKVEPL